MKPRSPSPIRDAVHRLLDRAESGFPDAGHRVWEVWDQALGKSLAARCQPLRLTRGHLLVGVYSAAWMQQLSFMANDLRQRLNDALGGHVIEEVRFRQADPPPAEPSSVTTPAYPPAWLTQGISPKVEAELRAQFREIQDPQLREAMLRARWRSEQLRSFREAQAGAEPLEHTSPPAHHGETEGS